MGDLIEMLQFNILSSLEYENKSVINNSATLLLLEFCFEVIANFSVKRLALPLP
jgi:hypothetical protein